jgi:hypothetical protein
MTELKASALWRDRARLAPLPATLGGRRVEQRVLLRDKNGQALSYFYFEDDPGRQTAANLLTRDEARRMAALLRTS